MQPANLSSNIWKYAILLITNKRVFAAIIAVYYLTIPDVTAQTIGFILLMSNLAGFIFEVPSGYLSDKIGHKEALVISKLMMVISTTLLIFADNITYLVLAGMLMNISWAFSSGTTSAFLHETLRGLGRDHEYTKISGKLHSLGFGIPVIFMVVTPFLVGISYKAPFIFSLVLDIIGLLVALTLVKPNVTQEHIDEVNTTNFVTVMKEGLKLNFFKYATFLALVMSFIHAVNAFRAPYQEVFGISVIWMGVLFGLGRAVASILLYYSGHLKERFSDIMSFFRFELLVFTLLLLVLVATQNVWVIAITFILINGFHWGMNEIRNGFMLKIIGSSKFKATLMSVHSQLKNIFTAITSFLLGFGINETSYQTAYAILIVLLLASSIPLYLYIKSSRKRMIKSV